MDDPFPDKRYLHWSIHTNTKYFIEALFACDVLQYMTSTSLRRTIEQGLGVPPGYLDHPMYKAMMTAVAKTTFEHLASKQAMRIAGARTFHDDDGDTRPFPGRTFPADVYVHIAQYLSKADLRALSLSCHATCEPAQMALFHDIIITVRDTPDTQTIEDAITFFSENTRVAAFVRRFTAQTCDLDDNATVSSWEIQRLLGLLPGLTRLTLVAYDWVPAPFELTPFERHRRLRKLGLLGVYIRSPVSSPLEIMAMAQTWQSVQIEYLTHTEDCLAPYEHPVVVPHLSVHHFPWFNATDTIPNKFRLFRNVITLRCEYIIETHGAAVAHIIQNSTGTLKWLYFRISVFDKDVPLAMWEPFFESLRTCSRLKKLSLSISAQGGRRGRPRTAKATFDSKFVAALLAAVSRSVKCLELEFDLKGASKTAVGRSFDSLQWDLFGSAVERMHQLEAVGVRFTSFYSKNPQWSEGHRVVIQATFPQLPKVIKDRRPYHIICCKSAEEERTARHLLRCTYGR